ncbi:hypothetical protein C8F01DRAFT_1371069 [Mycena amicta]|nr:hypothetical protein C8F01DRAFT_1371069 [Mycena amicta]
MLAPVLPPELECAIFEFAAWHDRATTLKLVFVARRVHIWIGPLRWRVLVLSETISLRDLLQNMPPDGSTHIRHLALAGASASLAETEQFLSMCPNITNISLWSGDLISPRVLRQLHEPTKLTHLSTDLTQFRQENRDSALGEAQLTPLRTVSHLELFGERPSPTILPIFRLLPALTHLAFAGRIYAPEVFKAVLQACDDSLRLLVFICEDRDLTVEGPDHQQLAIAVAEEEIADSRFCIVEWFDFTEDWVLGAWGGRDFWSRAEERSAMRARALQNGSAA